MTAQDILIDILKAHELDLMEYKGWIFINESLPAISAYTQDLKIYEDNGASIRLNIGVLLEKDKIIWESFAGVGKDEPSALRDALHNFSLNSLHVFLSAFWDIEPKEHVGIEQWEINGNLWEVFIGNFGCKGDYNTPENLFSVIEEQVKQEKLTDPVNWFRLYYGHINDENIVLETLKNNEDWNMEREKITNLNWGKSEKFYSLRNFILLKKLQ